MLRERTLSDSALEEAQKARADIVAALSLIEREAVELREKHGFTDKTIAAAAAYFQETTDLADKLRKPMLREQRDQSLCPYCNGPIGDAPELDHIHPKSHGGFSVQNNLVFSCSNCNNKKCDLTLLEFADLMGFDFRELVERLRALGKRA